MGQSQDLNSSLCPLLLFYYAKLGSLEADPEMGVLVSGESSPREAASFAGGSWIRNGGEAKQRCGFR